MGRDDSPAPRIAEFLGTNNNLEWKHGNYFHH